MELASKFEEGKLGKEGREREREKKKKKRVERWTELDW